MPSVGLSWIAEHVNVPFARSRVWREAEAPLSQVLVSAGGEAHEEDVRFQCQRLHAAVRPAGQEARVLVRRAAGEVSESLPPPTDPGRSTFAHNQIFLAWPR